MANPYWGTAMMHEHRESDSSIVPEKPPNKAAMRNVAAEGAEGRGLAEGNTAKQTRSRTQRRVRLKRALDRVRGAARREGAGKLTALWHHVYNVARLREAYASLKRDSAPGLDGETWRSYGEDLDSKLCDLSGRLQRGSYRAYAVKRTYVPKADGRQRPIGIPVLEDKIAQKSAVDVLTAVYELEFKNFSYGFRPGRSQHDALDALTVGLERRKINWILDADIQGFFDNLDHGWLLQFIEHRIADKRVLRHIRKWLKAGVMEEQSWYCQEVGTPQGGSISPLLANIYLHYVLDLWVSHWRRHSASGDVIIVRYADDFVVGFQFYEEAQRFRRELEQRLGRFNLRLHPKKTRLFEFGRFAASNRQRRGLGKPETFEFLGFTHVCGQTRNGQFTVRRLTSAARMRRKLTALKVELRRRMHWRIGEVGRWLRSVLLGHYRYYGVPFNYKRLEAFKHWLVRLWYKTLQRRSHKSTLTWDRMTRYVQAWLPNPRLFHPFPSERLIVNTRGRSPMR
jgi:group II intron reverse transcriptase/maturase